MKKLKIYSFSASGKGRKLILIMNLTLIGLLLGFMQVLGNDLYPGESENMTSTQSGLAFDQQAVTGKVTDDSGEAVPGATIIEKGTSNGTVSDFDGNYSIVPETDSPVLVFSFVGMISQEIQVGGQTQINVTMQADYIGIEEVVAIGYGTMKKSDLTGSVSSVTPEKLVDRPVVNVGQALQNKVAGVQVIRQAAGDPGGRPQIRIRGTNSINSSNDPLFVVDGIVGVLNALQNLDPEDIESMDILKDASATAIYGTRGANGVIIITTKRGTTGDVTVNYNGSVSVGIKTRYNYAVDADQFMYLYEQAFNNTPKYGNLVSTKDFRGPNAAGLSWSEMPWLFEQVAQGAYLPGLDFQGNDGNYYKPIFNTILEDEVFRDAFSYKNHVEISGGTEKGRYSLTLGNNNVEGLLKESYNNRLNLRATMDVELSEWLDMSANIAYAKSKQDRMSSDMMRNTSEYFAILPAYRYPNDPEIYGAYAGTWPTARDFNVGENRPGSTFMLDQEEGYYKQDEFTGAIELTAQITPDLTFRTNFSVDNRNQTSRYYAGDYQGRRNSDARGEHWLWQYWQSENYFNYNKTIGDHQVTGLIGLSWSENTYDYVYARAYKFSSNFYQWNNLGAGSNPSSVASSNTRGALNSYFARATYSYLDKYMLTATGRVDGSSKFGTNNKYAFFPSVGLAWRISQEGFLADSETISNLKLRLSAGQTGNQEVGNFITQTYISSTNVLLANGLNSGLYPGSTGNDDLKWETTTQYDVGVDVGLIKNRINFTVDFYHKLTTDMLFNLPLPQSTTTGSAYVNFGSVKNTGVEFTLNTVNIQKRDLTWQTQFNISANKNEITELGPTGADIYTDTGAGNGTSVYRVGEPIGSFFGLNRMGTWGTDEAVEAARYGRLPGDLKFEDVNQDGKIELLTDGDVIGHSYPKFYGGLNNTFTYKNFDASIDIMFVGGVDKAIVHESAEDRQFVNGMMNAVLDGWRPDHQETMIAQVRAGNAGARYDSYPDTHMIWNAAYIRGQNAQIGYTIPGNLGGIERLRVYATADNFFLWTAVELPAYDPEGSAIQKINTRVPNIDKYMHPVPTTFSLGVNVTF
ncbi:SusC/RagA family TonB-linked outer membrane protein [Maribellus comscasis]|uniref:SusC/RagA family TonB-linked outer membrane protein n=1 Tax=Maribellus comscasis TaxID=2681766 RepID=A0A6I6JWD2_9BACT|nr:TonB-dependent receptor [Maribellus comscasis]QGY43473.1 SusC/RagA family TonB-linked outer membrane protein [Maribellus comscasis]